MDTFGFLVSITLGSKPSSPPEISHGGGSRGTPWPVTGASLRGRTSDDSSRTQRCFSRSFVFSHFRREKVLSIVKVSYSPPRVPLEAYGGDRLKTVSSEHGTTQARDVHRDDWCLGLSFPHCYLHPSTWIGGVGCDKRTSILVHPCHLHVHWCPWILLFINVTALPVLWGRVEKFLYRYRM